MKLEIKHIAPYLPYKLKYILYGITTNSVHHVSFAMAEDIVDSINKDDMIRKLLLRPMSDLYKPLENGEVPIVELAKICCPSSKWILGMYEDKENDESWQIATNKNESWMFYYSEHIKGFHFASYGYYDYTVCNQLQLFQYLFEHHFDVFDLRSKELCIYYNEL